MRVIKVHRARCRIAETNVVCPFPPKAPRKGSQQVYTPQWSGDNARNIDEKKKQNTRQRRIESIRCDHAYAKKGRFINNMRLCFSSKKHPRRRSKAAGRDEWSVLVSIQGGRAQY